ncbi:glycosyl transferase family 14 [Myroides marinus]|uniref:beta-1,6-N-acetylglucosaminyltransferase n=1 Tax=Myroides marinus TaxID=703342 RepID=UPI00257738AA|nr:beta-1,6-N-acetylglucosaminyltransferase [Myroides marinus]MDM1384254.1 glycosyl transferase family 14 [Myroides marinus]
MSLIYILQVHKNPEQVCRMLTRLQGYDVYFYIHVDLKVEIEKFSFIKETVKNVFFIENRIDCIWGDFSQVQATFNLLDEVFAISDYNDDDRVIFLSGQDYPIKSSKIICEFLDKNKECEFINMEDVDKLPKHFRKRIDAFKINYSNNRGDYCLFSIYFLKNILKKLFLGQIFIRDLKYVLKRKEKPNGLKLFRGSNWWGLRISTLKRIKYYYSKDKRVLEPFFRSIISVDEVFFQTMMESYLKDDTLKIMPSLTYDNWFRKGVELPVTFTIEDIDELITIADNKLFARKFDCLLDYKILDYLDEYYK